MDKQRLLLHLSSAREELLLAARVIGEQGLRRFARPLALGAALLFIVHRFFCLPPAARLGRIRSQIDAAKATARHAERYRDLESRLKALHSVLPDLEARDVWLIDTAREAMKAEGIYLTSLSPVAEKEAGAFLLVSLTIGCRASYRQIASWVARLEGSRRLLWIAGMDMQKDPAEIGMNQVTMTIAAVVAKEAGAP